MAYQLEKSERLAQLPSAGSEASSQQPPFWFAMVVGRIVHY
jgi:hypothetical protein